VLVPPFPVLAQSAIAVLGKHSLLSACGPRLMQVLQILWHFQESVPMDYN